MDLVGCVAQAVDQNNGGWAQVPSFSDEVFHFRTGVFFVPRNGVCHQSKETEFLHLPTGISSVWDIYAKAVLKKQKVVSSTVNGQLDGSEFTSVFLQKRLLKNLTYSNWQRQVPISTEMDGKLGAGNLRHAVGRLVRFGVPWECVNRGRTDALCMQ